MYLRATRKSDGVLIEEGVIAVPPGETAWAFLRGYTAHLIATNPLALGLRSTDIKVERIK